VVVVAVGEFTAILKAVEAGDPSAASQLLPLVYKELRWLAARRLAREEPGLTLDPTALVHEAYLRLVGPDPGQHWEGRGHFFAAAAEAMRRILIEHARRKRSRKHGGDHQRQPLDEAGVAARGPSEELLALDEALSELAQREPSKAELVKLRYFAGLTLKEAAAVLGISITTADRYWAYARAWLHAKVTGASLS
jgi:RNA polymerase sigma factor (TIGR02999 family)